MTDYATPFLVALNGKLSPDMKAAVSAWQLQESGSQVTGNNPWNLHIGPPCPSTAGEGVGGYRPSQPLRSTTIAGLIGNRYAGPGDRNVAIFDTPDHGAAAAARNLLRSDGRLYGYDKVVQQARIGDPIGFLDALAASSWSAGRYGTRNGGPNKLIVIYRRVAPVPTPKPVQEDTPMEITRALLDSPAIGDTPPGTRRFAVDGSSEYDQLEDAGKYLFTARVAIQNGSRTPHGAFLETATRPPFLVPAGAVTFEAALPDPVAISVPPIGPATASSAFVGAFGATPYAIWTKTLAAIIAAGEYVRNEDGSWPAKDIATWRLLFTKYGSDAAVAAYDVLSGLPQSTGGTGASAYPDDMVANIAKYFCGLVGTGSHYAAYRDGKLLGETDNPADPAAWAASLGLNPNGWY